MTVHNVVGRIAEKRFFTQAWIAYAFRIPLEVASIVNIISQNTPLKRLPSCV
jgi:hypothetical protein